MPREFTDDSRFWIVFDTCSRPAYYRDVHNLLAAPSGAILRYDYKDKYLSDEVIAAIGDKTKPLPSRVLLAYVQDRSYRRGDGSPPNIDDFGAAFWLGTRVANMVGVHHAGEYFFDFQVRGYPTQGAALERIMRGQFTRKETPTKIYISFSPENGDFAAASAGGDDANWAAIVSILEPSPSQFAGDAFWRVASVRESGKAERIPFVLTSEKEHDEVRQVRSHLKAYEGKVYSCEVATRRSRANRQGGPPVEFRLQANSDEREVLRIVGTGQIDVRQYTRDHLEIESKALGLTARGAQISLNTMPKDGDWVQGAELTLRFEVGKRWGIAVLALGALAAGAVLGSTSLWKLYTGTSESLLSLLGLGCAAVLVAVGGSLWTGKLTK